MADEKEASQILNLLSSISETRVCATCGGTGRVPDEEDTSSGQSGLGSLSDLLDTNAEIIATETARMERLEQKALKCVIIAGNFTGEEVAVEELALDFMQMDDSYLDDIINHIKIGPHPEGSPEFLQDLILDRMRDSGCSVDIEALVEKMGF